MGGRIIILTGKAECLRSLTDAGGGPHALPNDDLASFWLSTVRWTCVTGCWAKGMSVSVREATRNVSIAHNEDSDSDLDILDQEHGDIAAR